MALSDLAQYIGALGGLPGSDAAVPQGPVAPSGPPAPGSAEPQPAFQIPGLLETKPLDLSDLNRGQRFGLGIQDIGNALQGAPSARDQLIAKRRAAYEENRKQLVESFGAANQLAQAVRSLPVSQAQQAQEQFRKLYGQLYPGAEAIFDSLAGNDLAEGILEQATDDPELQAYLASPAATLQGILEIQKSPEFLKRAAARQDQRNLPTFEEKLRKIGASEDPAIRGLVEKAWADGRLTIEEIKQVNEQLPEGPEGLRFTPSEIGAAERNQAAIAQRIPGFQTTEEFAKGRDTAAEEGRFERKERIKAEIQQEFENQKLGGGGKSQGPKIAGESPSTTFTVDKLVDETFAEYLDYTERSITDTGSLVSPLKRLLPAYFPEFQQIEKKFKQLKTESLLSRIARSGGTRIADTAREQEFLTSDVPNADEQPSTVVETFRRLREKLAVLEYGAMIEQNYRERGGDMSTFDADGLLRQIDAVSKEDNSVAILVNGEQVAEIPPPVSPEQKRAELESSSRPATPVESEDDAALDELEKLIQEKRRRRSVGR